jgi:anti-sigma regulatory factor (Ser/Thr protein kinase)
MQEPRTSTSLHTRLDITFLPLALSFAEESAKAFGLDPTGVLKLRLACEEVFVYLCRHGNPGTTVSIETVQGIYYVEVIFMFTAARFDPHALNLSVRVSPTDETNLDEMGLLIASRSVDGLRIIHDPKEGLGLKLIKEKSYPPLREIKPLEVGSLERFTFIVPDQETIKLFMGQILSRYPSNLYPSDFLFPGKVVDMVASGSYGALLVVGSRGDVGGGVIWRSVGAKTIEAFGPYLFLPRSEKIAEGLLDAFLGRIAKTDALCLINRYATLELPPGYFEPLGSIDAFLPDGTRRPWPFHYRQMKEDPGSQVWAHPDLEPFLRAEYGRLFFARAIRLASYAGEERPAHSVFAARFVRPQNLVNLNPLWDGVDASWNLAEHVRIIAGEGLTNIFVQMDLAFAWQANLLPALLENGFQPRLIIPYGGVADLVIFQHMGNR